jgi:Rps23 Pro-64 3,4-dihydroxylase Tpa1-like proline 4-hydroxylase
MTTGCVIFAQNTVGVDYVKLALFAAKRVKQFLSIPVSLATDSMDYLSFYPEHTEVFDKIINVYGSNNQQKRFYDGTLAFQTSEWKNLTRNQVYNITPYDRTLVIDSDFIINTDTLVRALENDYEFQIYKKSFDLASWRPDTFSRINQHSIPFYWGTVFIFEKTPSTESFFNLIEHIKTNWEYFRIVYKIDSHLYRNDFAFSIAIHIMNGLTEGDFGWELPGKMNFTLDRDFIISMKDSSMQFLLEKQHYPGEYTLVKTNNLDIHVMNKQSLTRLIDGGYGV